MASLQNLPLDTLYDNLFPHLDALSLLRLASTCKYFDHLIRTSNEADHYIWRRRLAQDFHFPVDNTARKSGWATLYKRVRRPRVYVWGETGNGRLGLARIPRHSASIASPVRLHLDGITIVDLVAGGWSFHALDSQGRVHFWGTLNGLYYARPNIPLTNSMCMVKTPKSLDVKLGLDGVSHLESGRAHCIAKGVHNDEVWEWYAWGSIRRINLEKVIESDQNLIRNNMSNTSTSRTTISNAAISKNNSNIYGVQQVCAGWDFSAILTKQGQVYIWRSITKASAFPRSEKDISSDSSTVYYVNEDMIRLPDIGKDEQVVKIACGDGFVVSLTDKGNVYKINVSIPPPPLGFERDENEEGEEDLRRDRERLEGVFRTGERRWIHLTLFSTNDLPPITHITAHFHHFVAYNPDAVISYNENGQLIESTNSTENERGMVLMGRDSFESNDAPEIIHDLQGRGVIKVVMGDYHFGALTMDGKLLTWGQYSAGALGHGRNNERLLSHDEQNDIEIQNSNMLQEPHRVYFGKKENHQDLQAEGLSTEKEFVFNAAFAGWHSSALVVSLDDSDDGEEEEHDQQPPQQEEEEDNLHQMPGGFRRIPPFPFLQPRFGLAAAGRMQQGTHDQNQQNQHEQ